MENRVFEVEIELEKTPESPSEHQRIIKFYRPGRWNKNQILEEHQYLTDLKNTDIPSIAPLPDKFKRSVVKRIHRFVTFEE